MCIFFQTHVTNIKLVMLQFCLHIFFKQQALYNIQTSNLMYDPVYNIENTDRMSDFVFPSLLFIYYNISVCVFKTIRLKLDIAIIKRLY